MKGISSESSALSPIELAAAGLAVSKANDCKAGVKYYVDQLRAAGAPESLILSLRLGESPDATAGRRLNGLVFYARKLTLLPNAVGKEDLAELRAAGFEDAEVRDVVQILAYFNYVNRIANGMSLDIETVLSER